MPKMSVPEFCRSFDQTLSDVENALQVIPLPGPKEVADAYKAGCATTLEAIRMSLHRMQEIFEAEESTAARN